MIHRGKKIPVFSKLPAAVLPTPRFFSPMNHNRSENGSVISTTVLLIFTAASLIAIMGDFFNKKKYVGGESVASN